MGKNYMQGAPQQDAQDVPFTEKAGAAPAGLDELAGAADTLITPLGSSEAGGADGAPPAEPERSNAEIVAGLICLVRETVSELADLKTPRAMLTDDKAQAVGALWGAALDEWGVKLGESMGRYGAGLMALFGTVQIMAPIVAATRAEIATKDAKKPAQAPASDAPPGARQAPANDNAADAGAINPTWRQ